MSDYYDPSFYGTKNYYKHWTNNIMFTDSVMYFAEKYGAYWLIDVVAFYGPYNDFLIVTMDVKDDKGTFTVKEDTISPVLIEQVIEFTDLEVSVKFFIENGAMMFPSDR